MAQKFACMLLLLHAACGIEPPTTSAMRIILRIAPQSTYKAQHPAHY
jgi:hypothetical protein